MWGNDFPHPEGTWPYTREQAAVQFGHLDQAVIDKIARGNALGQALGGPVQILTPGKVNEIFHRDWTVHDRRLAAAIGFAARYDLARGFADTILWYRRHDWL